MTDFLYDLSNLSTAENLVDFWSFVQIDVGVPFSQMFLLALGIIVFLPLLYRFDDVIKAFAATSWIMWITGMFLWSMEVLPTLWMKGLSGLVGVAMVALFFKREE